MSDRRTAQHDNGMLSCSEKRQDSAFRYVSTAPFRPAMWCLFPSEQVGPRPPSPISIRTHISLYYVLLPDVGHGQAIACGLPGTPRA